MDGASVNADTSEKADDLWYEDGNIIIVAKDVGFRVYKGVLARKSPVFKDLLSLPQPPGQELIEECPVIRVHDSPQDMQRFLEILCDGVRYDIPHVMTTVLS